MISVNQLEYQASGSGESQTQKILAHLQANLGEWVAMPKLYEISGAMAVHSRIADLRKNGANIEQKNERPPGSRAIHSFYRLTLTSAQEVAAV
jgi:hypothetical protein